MSEETKLEVDANAPEVLEVDEKEIARKEREAKASELMNQLNTRLDSHVENVDVIINEKPNREMNLAQLAFKSAIAEVKRWQLEIGKVYSKDDE